MQISDNRGEVTVRFTQHEGRTLRDACYILKRLVANVPDALGNFRVVEHRDPMSIGDWLPEKLLAVANKYTPPKSQDKLDREDSELGPEDPPPKKAA